MVLLEMQMWIYHHWCLLPREFVSELLLFFFPIAVTTYALLAGNSSRFLRVFSRRYKSSDMHVICEPVPRSAHSSSPLITILTCAHLANFFSLLLLILFLLVVLSIFSAKSYAKSYKLRHDRELVRSASLFSFLDLSKMESYFDSTSEYSMLNSALGKHLFRASG